MDQQTKLEANELFILFKFIPSSQLLKLRQVSNIWNDAALPVLRKRLDLNFTLTENNSRNVRFLNFISNLTENGFVPSVMKLKLGKEDSGGRDLECKVCNGYATHLELGFVLSFPAILIEICRIFGTGNGPIIKAFILESAEINPAFQLLMISHLSPSLEILDMESGILDFNREEKHPFYSQRTKFTYKVIPKTHELQLALFQSRFPLNNLKKIGLPKCRSEQEKDLIQWLEILVKSAPNLTHDPIPESRAKYGISADDDGVNVVLKVEPQSEEDSTDSEYSDSLTLEDDLANFPPVQLGTDELEIVSKFIPSSQLLKLRRVSKVWNEAALPVLRKRNDLMFILTDEEKRNWDFLKFLRNLPENGFVASEMRLRGVNEREWSVVDLEKGSVVTYLEIWNDICKILGAGGTGRAIRRLHFELDCIGTKRFGALTSGMMLLMLRHLSTSLEIIDLELGFRNFALNEKALDEALDLFKNRFPFTNLKMIVPPSKNIVRFEKEQNALAQWLNILVQSAPNLTNDPVADCQVDPSDYLKEYGPNYYAYVYGDPNNSNHCSL